MANLRDFDLSKLRFAKEIKGKIKEVLTVEEINQLAKDKIIPHYILVHPLTKEESYCFISSEINEWFINNYVRREDYRYEQNLNLHSFDPGIFKINPTDKIPLELSRIKNLYKHDMQPVFSTPPCIYFLCNGQRIVYIGQSTNITLRVLAHISEKVKIFTSVYFMPCHISCLNKFERELINHYKPEYNQILLNKEIDGDLFREIFAN